MPPLQPAAPSTPKPPVPAALRWTVLVAISIAMFGNYYAYDAVAPVADLLQRMLGFTDTQIGTLNAIYSFPNIVLVLVGGIIVDRFGTRASTLAFAVICLAGAAITASTGDFTVMAAGRLIFGIGAESMIVAITVAIGRWFVGRQLGFAFGVNLSIARAGSWAADKSTSWFQPLYDAGWQPPLWLATQVMLIGVIGALVYYLLERQASRKFDLQQPAPAERFVWSDLWQFDRSYWYIVGLCAAFYAVVFPFRSTFAIKYFQHAHGLSLQDAGSLNAWVFFAAIFATPAFGLIADRIGHRSGLMALGSLLLAATFPVMMFSGSNLWVATVMIGIAFSLVPAVIWTTVPYLAAPERLGTAFGLMTMVQNIFWTLANVGAGRLNDINGASEQNPAGYEPMLWMFMAVSLVAVVFAIALRTRETGPNGHGLESVFADGVRR
jgi:MFS family permease